MSKNEFLKGKKMIEIHMLKLYPSSALNRDDAGEQKTAYYNGTLRNRISSQCMKRAYRTSETFKSAFQEVGVRTKRMPEYVGDKLEEIGVCKEDANYFRIILSGGKSDDKKKTTAESAIEERKAVQTAALAFYSIEELEKIVEICKETYEMLDEPKSKNMKKVKLEDIQSKMRKSVHPMSIDVAAFGRMVTDNMLKPVEGAMQFAQILSTNSAYKENDYFVACDDFVTGSSVEDSGGAMIGDIDYDSACYYIHAVADLDQFAENLKDCDNAEELVKLLPGKFTEVMAYTDPSARQNSFEAHVLPEVIFVEIKDKKRPLNRMKAFAEPCNRDVLRTSVNALAAHVDITNQKVDLGTIHAVWYCEDENDRFAVPENVTVAHSIPELVSMLNQWMSE